MDVPAGLAAFEPQGPFLEHIGPVTCAIEARTRVERVGGTLSFADVSLSVDEREVVRARAVWVVAA